jgi:hypothetical protein
MGMFDTFLKGSGGLLLDAMTVMVSEPNHARAAADAGPARLRDATSR